MKSLGLIIFLVLLSLSLVLARKNKAAKMDRTAGCRYGRPTKKGECVNGTRSVTLPLKFSKHGAICDPEKSLDIPCRIKNTFKPKKGLCQYRKELPTECDATNKRQIKKILVSGDISCPPELNKEVPCKANIRKEKKQRTNCQYSLTFTECNTTTNTRMLVRKLVSGDDTCEPEILKEKPCKQGVKGCKYHKTFGKCNPDTQKVTVTMTLKKGNQAVCEQTKTVEAKCRNMMNKRVCKYKKVPFETCDRETNTRSRNLFLRKGDPATCNATKLETRPCGKKSRQGKGGCAYRKGPWSACRASTNTVTRTLTLKKGDPEKCNQTITETGRCRTKHLKPQECKYRRTVWGDCDPITNKKSMVMTLKSGDQPYCQTTKTVEKECKRKMQNIGRVCKYQFGEWENCDLATNTRSRTLTLQSGNAAVCPQTKIDTRKCKIACKFREGKWSECNPQTLQMQRVDTIIKGSEAFCEKTRLITKKCRLGKKKKKKCKYDFGTWSDCNALTNKRTRIKHLMSGDPEVCEEEKVESKSCTRPNGKVRCFFGQWGEYEPCMNGVQKKQREVIQGGVDCQKKAVKMKSCAR
ncbi:hypothetical protein CHS0354_037434 [Potamilus streckersoni]|uniref:Pleiotrophin/Midkine C-terminal domain-containing protein n=1 Tax=Potamilus streckersoni TaxID=2493646 RepID=A0AAE0RRY4_9BIVA|nr:hypothetical protein CHS0354_037434 [Potamilus streckersoni]